jgi:hypothetical protein
MHFHKYVLIGFLKFLKCFCLSLWPSICPLPSNFSFSNTIVQISILGPPAVLFFAIVTFRHLSVFLLFYIEHISGRLRVDSILLSRGWIMLSLPPVHFGETEAHKDSDMCTSDTGNMWESNGAQTFLIQEASFSQSIFFNAFPKFFSKWSAFGN